jgi:Brp/Blh family beta-carotene 15,15'-monooxygenase
MVINAILLIAFYKILKWDKKDLLFFLAQSLMLCLIVYQLPLYLSFGFYFGFWHSGLSFNLIRKQMNLADTIEGWFNLIKRAIPFTLIAWLGIFILILLSSQIYTQLLILTNLFIGISILSLPHLQVFTKIKTQ